MFIFYLFIIWHYEFLTVILIIYYNMERVFGTLAAINSLNDLAKMYSQNEYCSSGLFVQKSSHYVIRNKYFKKTETQNF